jgi:hypothetical protein
MLGGAFRTTVCHAPIAHSSGQVSAGTTGGTTWPGPSQSGRPLIEAEAPTAPHAMRGCPRSRKFSMAGAAGGFGGGTFSRSHNVPRQTRDMVMMTWMSVAGAPEMTPFGVTFATSASMVTSIVIEPNGEPPNGWPLAIRDPLTSTSRTRVETTLPVCGSIASRVTM